MNVTVEHLAACKKLLRIEVDAETVGKGLDTATAEFQKYAQLPGFRAGKAPKHLVLKSFSSRIESEAKRQLMSKAFNDAIVEHKFRIMGDPDVEEIQFGRGKSLQFAATVEIAPEFETPEYKGIELKRETRVVTDTDVANAIEILRDQRATFNDVTREVRDGDYVVVDYNGTSEDKPLTDFAPTARGLTEKRDFWIHVAKDSFIPGFTEQLVGANIGETRTVNVDFPADFISKPLAGRKGSYQVTLKQIKEKQLPAVDDALAQAFGADDVDALRAGVRNDLENQAKFNQKKSLRDQIVQTLLSRVQFELPETVVLQETRSVVYDIVRENQERGVPKEALDQQKDEIFSHASNSARDRVKVGFILGRIAEAEKIAADDKEVTHRILAMSEQYRIKPERLVRQLQERNGIAEIRQQIINNKVLDFLELNGKIEESLPAVTPA